MKTYVVTTGAMFGLITLAHIWRMIEEGNMAREPWYLILTVVTAGLALWAWRLTRRAA